MRDGLEDFGAEASLAIEDSSAGSLENPCLGGALDSAGVGIAGLTNSSTEIAAIDLCEVSSERLGGSDKRVLDLESLSWDRCGAARDLVEAVVGAPTGGTGLFFKSQFRWFLRLFEVMRTSCCDCITRSQSYLMFWSEILVL